MDLLKSIREKATGKGKRIVLPEGEDERMLRAAVRLRNENICEVVLLGSETAIRANAAEIGTDLGPIPVIDPSLSSDLDSYAARFYEFRKHKGISEMQARETVTEPLFYGAMMVREDDVDGSVAGAVHTTGDVLKAGIQCIGLAENISVVSSVFLMIVPGWDRPFTYADGAVVPDPSPDKLAGIAIASADTHQKLTGEKPVVALLSFSTYGSANHPMVDKMKEATRIVKEKAPDLVVDGELQVDAAIIPAVAEKKAPGSPVAGRANVLIFPDLDAGNIAYKLTQRMANAEAIGPIIQGLRKPANDLSRGCSVDDIVNVAAICCLLSD